MAVGTGWKLLAGWSSWGPGRFKLRYGSVNNTLGALILWRGGRHLGALGCKGTWESGRGHSLQWDWAGPGPGFGRHFGGVLGLGSLGPEQSRRLWQWQAQSLGWVCIKYTGFLSARLEALMARTCTAAAGSGQAFSEPPPALAPSEASLPVLQ